MTEPRFFLEHGIIHDRQSGRHLTADFEHDYPQHLLGVLNAQEQVIQALRANKVIEDIKDERVRQVIKEGFGAEHDDTHTQGDLSAAAACYALAAFGKLERELHADIWPWSKEWWKPKDQRRDLVRAAALIVAEIERIDRASLNTGESK